MTPVTLVTDPAGRADALSEQDYRDIYGELRERRSLRQFIALVRSEASPSWWSQYETGNKRLDWQRKNELRRTVNMPALAPSVASAMTNIPSTAAVFQVGAGVPDTVLLLTPEAPKTLLLHRNGDLHISDGTDMSDAKTDTVTPITKATETSAVFQPTARKTYFRPCLPSDLKAVVAAQIQASGLSEEIFWRTLFPQEEPQP